MVISFNLNKFKALTNVAHEIVFGRNVKELKQAANKVSRAFYKNVNVNADNYGEGFYFAMKSDVCTFVFISADKSTVTIKTRASKNSMYEIKTFKLEMSSNNTDYLTVNTKTSKLAATPAIVIASTECVKIESTNDAEAKLAAALARIAELEAEVAELKTRDEQKDEVIVKVNSKRLYNFKISQARQRKIRQIMAISAQGRLPHEVLKKAKNVSLELEELNELTTF